MFFLLKIFTVCVKIFDNVRHEVPSSKYDRYFIDKE